MRPSHLLFSAVQFLFTMGLILLALFLIGLGWAPHLRSLAADLILDWSPYFGYGLLGVALALLLSFFKFNEGRYYQILLGSTRADVDLHLIRESVESYWRESMPGRKVTASVWIYPEKRLEVVAELPQLTEEEHAEVLALASKDLELILTKNLGCSLPIRLTVLSK